MTWQDYIMKAKFKPIKRKKPKGCVSQALCTLCGEMAYSCNPKLIPRHQHL